MSVEANKQLISALMDEVWNEHHPAVVGRFFGPGLREDRLALLRQVGAIAEPVAVNWAGGASPDAERSE